MIKVHVFCVVGTLSALTACGDDAPPMSDAGCTSTAEYDDGVFCSGTEACSMGVCQPGVEPCSGGVCDEATGDLGDQDGDIDEGVSQMRFEHLDGDLYGGDTTVQACAGSAQTSPPASSLADEVIDGGSRRPARGPGRSSFLGARWVAGAHSASSKAGPLRRPPWSGRRPQRGPPRFPAEP